MREVLGVLVDAPRGLVTEATVGDAKGVIAIQEGVVTWGIPRRTVPRGRRDGEVWIGRHLEIGTSIAVKFIDAVPTASDSARSRFKRDAEAAVRGLPISSSTE